MILKSFELSKINLEKNNYFLLYGENEGFKNDVIKKIFEEKIQENPYRYEEDEIFNNKESFFNKVLSKSFFEEKKIIIISRVTERIKELIEEIIDKQVEDIKIILNSGILEKKSKLRNFFEKNKKTICIPFYNDNAQTLNVIINNFFKSKKIPVSQQSINLLIGRCRGDRKNLQNELNKIENYSKNKKNINIEELLKLTNVAENYNVSELIDNCLSKNLSKTVNILNENNYSTEDCILITRTLLIKSKRLLKIKKEMENNKSIDETISSFKPPIFWKDKEIVKHQVKNWSTNSIENLIYQINEIELLVKKNSINSINILSDFIINEASLINN